MAQRNITDAAVTASKTQHGIAHAQCIEATFGAKVTSSQIIVTFAGPWAGMRVETSIDQGRTWQQLDYPDQEIPRLPKDTVIVHTEVMTRVSFIDHQDTVLVKSITTVVRLGTGPDGETGDVVTRTESGATLGSGSLAGCAYDPMRDGLAAVPQIVLGFSNTSTADTYGLAWGETHNADLQPSGLHISHGFRHDLNRAQGEALVPFEGQDINNPNHNADAACTVEIWVYPTKFTYPVGFSPRHNTILSWRVDDQQGTGKGVHGCALQLVADTQVDPNQPERAAIRFVKYEYVINTKDLEVVSTARVHLNTWSRIAMIYDGFRVRLVVNGAVSNTVAFRARYHELVNPPPSDDNPDTDYGVVMPTTGNFCLGADAVPDTDRPGQQFFGRLSELRLYGSEATLGTGYLKGRRRLSVGDIASLKKTDQLMEYWPLSTGHGTIEVGRVQGIWMGLFNVGSANGINWIPTYDSFLGRPYEVIAKSSTRAEGDIEQEPVPPVEGEDDPEDEGDVKLHVIDVKYAPSRISTPMVVEAKTNVVRIANAPFDVRFPDGRVFLGVGQYAGIDAIQEPTEISPTGINVSFTALDQSLVGLAMNAIYMDGSLLAYEVYFDANDQLVQDPVLIFGGLMDTVNIKGGKEPTVVVSAESQLRNWQRSSVIKWNDEGHRFRYPLDHGLEFVGRTVDQVVWWPAKTTEKPFKK